MNFLQLVELANQVVKFLGVVHVDGDGGIQPCPNATIVTDYDGNNYSTVLIGTQCWMAENLRTTHYANGVIIPMVNSTYGETTDPYCYEPNNNGSNVSTYGYLYNWHAVMHGESSSNANPSGVQGVCPTGWHVPSDAECHGFTIKWRGHEKRRLYYLG